MWLSIDPGEVHVGVAEWRDGELIRSYETNPDGIKDRMVALNRHLSMVVIEEFRLYPGKAHEQSFRMMKTSELIGVIKYLANRDSVTLVEQPASIKKPTFAILKAKGIELPKGSQHVKDAIAHGYYWLFKGQNSKKGGLVE